MICSQGFFERKRLSWILLNGFAAQRGQGPLPYLEVP